MEKIELDATTVSTGGYQRLVAQLVDWPAGRLGTQSARSVWSQSVGSETQGECWGQISDSNEAITEKLTANDKHKTR